MKGAFIQAVYQAAVSCYNEVFILQRAASVFCRVRLRWPKSLACSRPTGWSWWFWRPFIRHPTSPLLTQLTPSPMFPLPASQLKREPFSPRYELPTCSDSRVTTHTDWRGLQLSSKSLCGVPASCSLFFFFCLIWNDGMLVSGGLSTVKNGPAGLVGCLCGNELLLV